MMGGCTSSTRHSSASFFRFIRSMRVSSSLLGTKLDGSMARARFMASINSSFFCLTLICSSLSYNNACIQGACWLVLWGFINNHASWINYTTAVKKGAHCWLKIRVLLSESLDLWRFLQSSPGKYDSPVRHCGRGLRMRHHNGAGAAGGNLRPQ